MADWSGVFLVTVAGATLSLAAGATPRSRSPW